MGFGSITKSVGSGSELGQKDKALNLDTQTGKIPDPPISDPDPARVLANVCSRGLTSVLRTRDVYSGTWIDFLPSRIQQEPKFGGKKLIFTR